MNPCWPLFIDCIGSTVKHVSTLNSVEKSKPFKWVLRDLASSNLHFKKAVFHSLTNVLICIRQVFVFNITYNCSRCLSIHSSLITQHYVTRVNFIMLLHCKMGVLCSLSFHVEKKLSSSLFHYFSALLLFFEFKRNRTWKAFRAFSL